MSGSPNAPARSSSSPRSEARSPALKHNYIGTEHLLLGLLGEREGLAAHVSESMEVTVERVRGQVVGIGGAGEQLTTGMIPLTPRAKQVLELASQESLSLDQHYVGTEHILLALTRVSDGVGLRVLRDFDASPETIRQTVITRLSRSGTRRRPKEPVDNGPEARSTAAPAVIDPGSLDGLARPLTPLDAEIRAQLGRAPDVGDLLVGLACVPHTPAAQALGELGVDVDELAAVIKRVRAQAQAQRHALAEKIRETAHAKELAIEESRVQDAAQLRDHERELRDQSRAHPRAQLAAVEQLRRRLGLPTPPD